MRRHLLASLGVSLGAIMLASALPAAAQGQASAPASGAPATPAPPKLTPLPPIRGHVTSLAGDALTLKLEDGTSKTVTLGEGVRIIQVHRIDISAIKPGSFVATANVTQADGSGQSTELRVFGPSLKGMGEGHGPMSNRAPGTMMTNGTVSTEVVSTPRGQEMDVAYTQNGTKGVRHITVPKGMVITSWDVADRGAIKPGEGVEVRAGQAPDGSVIARAVLVSDTAAVPPPI